MTIANVWMASDHSVMALIWLVFAIAISIVELKVPA